MPGKIFVSYRRDDDPNGAARIRDALTAKFGRSSVLLDVDNLLAGLRFDKELANASAACDVFLAVIGPHWLELLKIKASRGDRDYVREEIASALRRKIVVIPVRVGRENQLPPLRRHRVVGDALSRRGPGAHRGILFQSRAALGTARSANTGRSLVCAWPGHNAVGVASRRPHHRPSASIVSSSPRQRG